MSFDTELSSRRKTLLYLYQICPLIDMIDRIYNMKKDIEHKESIQWYIDVFPFRNNTNKVYMRWFVKEFNIFSKLSKKGMYQLISLIVNSAFFIFTCSLLLFIMDCCDILCSNNIYRLTQAGPSPPSGGTHSMIW